MSERHDQYESLIRTLEGRIWWLEKKVDAIKFRFNNIPKKFVTEAHATLDRGTDKHRVWDFEVWFNGAMGILETSQFKENDENES